MTNHLLTKGDAMDLKPFKDLVREWGEKGSDMEDRAIMDICHGFADCLQKAIAKVEGGGCDYLGCVNGKVERSVQGPIRSALVWKDCPKCTGKQGEK